MCLVNMQPSLEGDSFLQMNFIKSTSLICNVGSMKATGWVFFPPEKSLKRCLNKSKYAYNLNNLMWQIFK